MYALHRPTFHPLQTGLSAPRNVVDPALERKRTHDAAAASANPPAQTPVQRRVGDVILPGTQDVQAECPHGFTETTNQRCMPLVEAPSWPTEFKSSGCPAGWKAVSTPELDFCVQDPAPPGVTIPQIPGDVTVTIPDTKENCALKSMEFDGKNCVPCSGQAVWNGQSCAVPAQDPAYDPDSPKGWACVQKMCVPTEHGSMLLAKEAKIPEGWIDLGHGHYVPADTTWGDVPEAPGIDRPSQGTCKSDDVEIAPKICVPASKLSSLPVACAPGQTRQPTGMCTAPEKKDDKKSEPAPAADAPKSNTLWWILGGTALAGAIGYGYYAMKKPERRQNPVKTILATSPRSLIK